MGLQQFERRLERMVESVFARAFRSGLQPVEIGRRLTREMDLRRTIAPRGSIVPNQFTVVLSPSDRSRFAPIEDELVSELIEVARDHAETEDYVFLGPVAIIMQTDEDLGAGMVLVSGEMIKSPEPGQPAQPAQPAQATQPGQQTAISRLVLADGRTVELGSRALVVGRLPDSGLVLADPNVSRYHAEFRPVAATDGHSSDSRDYEVTDMGSTNGTKVNGVRISTPQVLRDGDTITVGVTAIRYEQA
jgi:Protein of unknown function (DUF3662)/FHA domain